MALAILNANGQLPAAAAALYTATNPGSARVSLVNTDVAARQCNLYLNRGGTRRKFLSVSLAAGANWPSDRPYGPVNLRAGDSIDGDAAAATVVDYAISVVELS